MRYLYFLLTLFFVSSCGSDCTYTYDSKEWSEEWSEDIVIVFEGEEYNRDNNWINVRKHDGEEITGSYCSFDPKGRQVRKENYLNGKLHGLVLKYDKYKEVITDSVSYENGYKEGREIRRIWSDYHNKLIPRRITNYSKNLKNGSYMKYYDRNDEELEEQLEEKGNYKDGKPDGYWEKYWGNGNIRMRITYIEGKKIKLFKSYDEDGKIESVTEYVQSETGIEEKNNWGWRSHVFGKSVWCQIKQDGKNIWFYFDKEGNVKSDQEYNKEHKNLVHYDYDGYSDWTVNGYSY